MRAIEWLARIGTSEARTLLAALAGGPPDSAITDAAKAALSRFG